MQSHQDVTDLERLLGYHKWLVDVSSPPNLAQAQTRPSSWMLATTQLKYFSNVLSQTQANRASPGIMGLKGSHPWGGGYR